MGMLEKPLRTWGLVIVGLVVLLAGAGCGRVRQAAVRQKRMNDLKVVGLAYHNFVDAENKAPSGPADLIKYMSGDPGGTAAVSDGSFTFIYGVKPQEMTQGASMTVIGYETAAPTSGGLVLMGDGSVNQVTAQAFQGMTKAQPKAK